MRNWEKYIYDCMGKLGNMIANITEKEIRDEIVKCYCFEFIDRTRYEELISELDEKIIQVEGERQLRHEQYMYENDLRLKKRQEQEEIKNVFICADDEYKRKSQKRGRPKRNTLF